MASPLSEPIASSNAAFATARKAPATAVYSWRRLCLAHNGSSARSSLRNGRLDARPEVVIHEMTAISNASDLAHFDRGLAATNRLRTDGVDYLLAAARECGARRFIAPSFCGWPFARMGGPVKTEEDALDPAPPREFRNSLAAIHHLEGAVAGSTALEGVVLRYGAFYGPGTGLFDGGVVDQLRRRRIPV